MKPVYNCLVGRMSVAATLLFTIAFAPMGLALSQDAVPEAGVREQLEKLSEEVDDLKAKLKKLKDDKSADSLVTLGGGNLRLGGKVELNFLDSQNDDHLSDALGSNFVPEHLDPHLELQRLRLAPVFALNRWIKVQSQLDFQVDGDTLLKEMAVRHDIQPNWWLRSRFQLGLDDRFIRPARRTKTYPLIGNAFWRDESLAAVWQLTFGHRKGTAAGVERFEKNSEGSGSSGGGAFTEGFAEDAGGDGGFAADVRGPFDFSNNWGAFRASLSLGQGYQLGNKEVTFDAARFNDIIQDDRELEDDLAFGELGIGLGWERDFERLGDVAVSAFYFTDQLSDGSIAFLTGDLMTNRFPDNSVESGYGDSTSDGSSRYGVGFDYFLSAEDIFPHRKKSLRKQDGLRLAFQFISAEDGELDRDGWYTQASYRFSFGKLLGNRYFRSVEPLVRYGVLNVDAPGSGGTSFKDPGLPGTWDRQALTLGAIVEVTGDIFMKFEYVMNSEDGGGVEVDNDELLLQLLLTF